MSNIHLVLGFDYEDTKIDSAWSAEEDAEVRSILLIAAHESGIEMDCRDRSELQKYAVHYDWVVKPMSMNEVPIE